MSNVTVGLAEVRSGAEPVDVRCGARYLKTIEIGLLRYESQTRATTDGALVAEYRDKMRSGERFPPPVVFMDETDAWLADGFHRVAARKLLGDTSIECSVARGGRLDAVVYGATSNDAHGQRRTNADKRRSVAVLLEVLAEKGENWSDRRIAESCGVGHPLVAEARRRLEDSSSDQPKLADSRRTAKDGRQMPARRDSNQRPDSPPASSSACPVAPRFERARQRREVVQQLHANGMGTLEIARATGTEPSIISNDKVVLGIGENSPALKLWRDAQHVAATLEGSLSHIEKLAAAAAQQPIHATQEDIESCAKKLSKAATVIRQLSTALRGRIQ